MRASLNLATTPARNERLPALLFGVAASLLLALSLVHGFTVARLASTAATTLDEEVERLAREREELRAKERELRSLRVAKPSLDRWGAVKALVDQRAFSWTGLLSRLENALPPDVRLQSIAPATRQGRFLLSLEVVVRTADDAVPLVKALEDRPEFEEVFLAQIGEGSTDVTCHYEMLYRPEAARSEAPGSAAAEALGAGAPAPEVGP
jgi:hypothetical protein